MLTASAITNAMRGLIVGDALGVPVEFCTRDELDRDPVSHMRGFGTYMQPAGTWSDDSSMALCSLESLTKGYDLADMMSRFRNWSYDAYMTPHGATFDIGFTCADAISAFKMSGDHTTCGMSHERSNGNGSLMRIMPLSLATVGSEPAQIIAKNYAVSGLTHGHIRSQLCCAIYSLMVSRIVAGDDLRTAHAFAVAQVDVPDDEQEALAGILSGECMSRDRDLVRSSGYVVHSLEASLWCVANHSNYAEATLAAVNLGGDTDTTGAIAGGLAGLLYGEIPNQWWREIARHEDLDVLISAFAERYAK
jgi:ADP-ribosylglycohydrolase